ncbi:MAG: hypothetical protein LBI31_01745 [Zoogloeaceae bacterium]|jgi:hypothetical protein|nr:hypothetical protein [Zoogloeaceae bacterium]
MNAFNKEYFFIMLPDDDRLPYLKPDDETNAKPYEWEILPIGGKPLTFYNALDEDAKEGRIPPPISPPPDVLFDGVDLVVIDRIACKLREMEIPNLGIQSAVYIDHEDHRHENYWFLTFTIKFACWDKKTSRYDPEPIPLHDDIPFYEVWAYSLDESLLQKTPLPERRLFKMGETLDGYIVAHQSIVDLFRVEGVDIVPITDY